MIGIRVENLPDENVIAMDQYYMELLRREQESRVVFNIMMSPIYNFCRTFLPFAVAERGNCARWTSLGLESAGVVTRTTMWPKGV
jgi:hypothetical protein